MKGDVSGDPWGQWGQWGMGSMLELKWGRGTALAQRLVCRHSSFSLFHRALDFYFYSAPPCSSKQIHHPRPLRPNSPHPPSKSSPIPLPRHPSLRTFIHLRTAVLQTQQDIEVGTDESQSVRLGEHLGAVGVCPRGIIPGIASHPFFVDAQADQLSDQLILVMQER